VSRMITVSSRIVGPWTILWHVCWWLWNNRQPSNSSRIGRHSTSSQGTVLPGITEKLVAHRIASTSRVPRWLLIYASVPSLEDYLGTLKSGRSSEACGDVWEAGGEGLFRRKIRTIST